MWHIYYDVYQSYRDNDNYASSSIIYSSYVTGDTVSKAKDNLIKKLGENSYLESVVSTYAEGLGSYDNCYNVEINDVIFVKDRIDLSFSDIEQFKKMVESRQLELESLNKKKVEIDREKKEAEEKLQLAILKEKYEN